MLNAFTTSLVDCQLKEVVLGKCLGGESRFTTKSYSLKIFSPNSLNIVETQWFKTTIISHFKDILKIDNYLLVMSNCSVGLSDGKLVPTTIEGFDFEKALIK